MLVVSTLFRLSMLASTTVNLTYAWSLAGSSSGQRSAFTGSPCLACPMASSLSSSSNTLTMYETPRDPPNDKHPHQRPFSNTPNAWAVLSTTEKWISATLQNSNAAGGPGGNAQTNPYSRKEVSYVCESSSDQAMIVASLFRRLKEARELGETHGQQELVRSEQTGSSYRPSTLRQTQVIVIPSNEEFQNSFIVYNAVIEAINQARRHARDYVTEAHWDRLDSASDEEEESEWSVAVNCAHLHPNFGEKTPEQELEELQREDEEGEVDVHYEEYLKKKQLARQSPYPTVVIEVRATPPPDFGASKPPSAAASSSPSSSSSSDDAVTAADIMKLEELFGKTAAMGHPTKHTTSKQEEEAFYSSIGDSIQELSAVTPLTMAQNYMATADPSIPATAAFTETNTAAVDEAYEFVFTNVAMMTETVKQQTTNEDVRHYVVMPHFVASSATSLEKFASQLSLLLNSLPDLADHIHLQTYHPEHIHETQRSPMPILRLQWQH